MKKKLGLVEAKLKIQSYCAYQERCHKEVKEKLYSFGLHPEHIDSIMADLIVDNFLNEQRFAESFAGGKFRMKKWGKIKIVQQLKLKGISEYSIKKGLEEIQEEDYQETLSHLIQKKWEDTSGNPFERKDKVYRYLMNKGFESYLIMGALQALN